MVKQTKLKQTKKMIGVFTRNNRINCIAAKKKMWVLYNQFKANTQKSNPQNQNQNIATSSMPTTNAQYR